MVKLSELGWSPFFEQGMHSYRTQGFEPGRVSIEHRDSFIILTERGEITAEIAGRLLYARESAADLPKVGDWVALQVFDGHDKAIIHHVLARKTVFSRKTAGKKVDEQVMATNIDVVFVVQSLDSNFNVRRLERTLVMVNESGASPIILLNKADLSPEPAKYVAEAKKMIRDAEVLVISAKQNTGLIELRETIRPGQTYAFIGSSGVGKSTIINRLVGDNKLKTQEVRVADSKGRHTTTRRELVLLKEGGCLIDTPGMRELQLWQAEEGITDTFSDIDALAAQCHFSDCTHIKEIRCAVRLAVNNGELPPERYESYMKLQEELAHLDAKRAKQPLWVMRQKERSQGRLYKQILAEKRRREKGS